jgi:TIR domain
MNKRKAKRRSKHLTRSYKIFVSYARADAWAAGQIAKELQLLGVEVFLDTHSIATGDLFQTRILDALRSSDEVVALLTADSIGRTWVQQ